MTQNLFKKTGYMQITQVDLTELLRQYSSKETLEAYKELRW